MPAFSYQKSANPALDAEFQTAPRFGKVKVGPTHIFWKKLLQWEALDRSEVERFYRRVEEVVGQTGCCSNDFSIHKLMASLKTGETLEILIGDSLYRHEPERLMEALGE